MTDEILREIKAALAKCSAEQRQTIFQELRQEFPIHEIERELNVSAEIILEAIARASDLTLRGIRGIVAEAVFALNVVPTLQAGGWQDVTPGGDLAFDFDLAKGGSHVRIQVKNQRRVLQQPMIWRKAPPNGVQGRIFVAETQRTRSGKDANGTSTRPYKFTEFDILAVCMHPSTGNWTDFRYTVASWLVPRGDDASLIQVLQPVAEFPNIDWTSDFETAAGWFRSGDKKTIWN